MNFRTKLVAGLAAVAISGLAAVAAGMFPGLPIVGSAAFCGSTNQPGGPGTPTVCTNTVPAGPTSLTGSELIPADTALTQGQAPQTVLIPSGVMFANGQGSSRNVLVGGDFATNLWQRGTTFTSLTPTTTTMTADRWGVYSSGNTVTITRQTGASDIVTASGLLASMRVNRPSGTNTTAICVGQVLPAKDAARFLGNNAVFSFWGLSGAGFLTTNKQITATIAVYTAADSATPGTNTDAFMKATVAGYTQINATATQTIALSTTWTRYSVFGTVPQTVASNQVTGIGVTLCATYPASTGVAGDWFEFAGAQLEAHAVGITVPGSFSRRLPSDEAEQQQAYSFVLTDAAATVRFPGFCVEVTANTTGTCTITFPAAMRITPATTISTATSFSMRTAADAANACTALTAIASSNTPQSAGLSCAAAGTVAAGVASPFVGAATAGTVTFSAEP